MNTTPSFSQLMQEVRLESENHCSANIPENWMQGRTTYGGLSAALCLRAAELTQSDLPPLRSALITFVGPVGGAVNMHSKVLRRGKSVSNIQVDMTTEMGYATQAVLCFGTSRESRFDKDFSQAAEVPGLAQSEPFFGEPFQGPVFAKNFDTKLAQGGRPISGSEAHEHYIWVRHRDEDASDTAALIGIADMPPPAVLPMFKEFAPISSMTWMINFLSTNHRSSDGWWLMRTAAEHAREGYSSQDMQVWNADGELVISGRQNVAVFY